MRRGRRMALNITLVLQLAVAALAAVYLGLFALIPHYPTRPHTAAMGSGFAHILPLVTVPLLLAVLLWANRRQFRVETVPSARRMLAAVVGGVWLVFSAAMPWPGRRPEACRVMADCWACLRSCRDSTFRFRFPTCTGGCSPTATPGSLLFAYSGPVFWLVALAGVWWVLLGRPPRQRFRRGADRDDGPDLLQQGGDSLSWMALWEPNRYWFSPDGGGAVAYQQHGSVALTLAGPFGPPAKPSGRGRRISGPLRQPCPHSCVLLLQGRACGRCCMRAASVGWPWPRRPGSPCGSSSSRARNGRTSARP